MDQPTELEGVLQKLGVTPDRGCRSWAVNGELVELAAPGSIRRPDRAVPADGRRIRLLYYKKRPHDLSVEKANASQGAFAHFVSFFCAGGLGIQKQEFPMAIKASPIPPRWPARDRSRVSAEVPGSRNQNVRHAGEDRHHVTGGY